ncbi:MAG: hypothetical protein H7144_03775 [Burkholderiales bacterium]|nr:hypothetical protein [Phycisphaerae bacterium]
MRLPVPLVTVAMTLALTNWSVAQDDPIEEPEQPTAVVLMPKPPATKLESFEQGIGAVIVKGFTRVGNLASDDQAEINIYAVAMSDGNRKQYGAMFEFTIKDFRPVRCYVDEDEIGQLLDGLSALSRVDKTTLPLDTVEAVFRTRGSLEIFNRDQNGGRVAVIRGTVVSAVTGYVRVARASFRTARLSELTHQLTLARDVITRLKGG